MENEMETVFAARARWQKIISGKGDKCPVCDRFGKIYARPFNAPLARLLMFMYQHSNPTGDFAHVPSIGNREVLRQNKVGLLGKWGLLEQLEDGDPKKKCSGYWRITQAGVDLCERRTRIQKYLYTYNDQILIIEGLDSEWVTIDEALRSGGFDYREMMESILKSGTSAVMARMQHG